MSFDDSGSIYKRTADPTVNDDYTQDYVEGDSWENTVTGKTFKCFDGTIGAAVWKSDAGTNTPGDIGGGAASMVMSFASGSTKHVETTSSTYANLAHFIYGGSDAIGAITKINVNAWVIGNSTADIRLVIKDTGLVIAEYIGISSNDEANDFDIGTLSNIPTGREVIEIQGRKVTGGGGAKLRIGSLELEY